MINALFTRRFGPERTGVGAMLLAWGRLIAHVPEDTARLFGVHKEKLLSFPPNAQRASLG